MALPTAAGVHEELIANHVRANGMAAPLQTGDIIHLQQQGVSPHVIGQMQASPPRPAQPAGVAQPVIVEEHHYGPYWGPRHYRPHPCWRPAPGVSWGVSVSNL